MRDALSESLYTLLFDLNRQWSQPPMNILEVIKNEFLHNLKTDHIAVDHTGTPIARAADRASVEHAAPNAAAYFSGADFATTDSTPLADAVVATGVSAVTPTPIVSTPPEFFPAPPAVRDWPTGAIVKAEPVSPPTATATPFISPATTVTGIPATEQPSTTTLASASAPPIESAGLPTEPYPSYTPAGQPPQDNDHVEPGAEQFPGPATTVKSPAKLN